MNTEEIFMKLGNTHRVVIRRHSMLDSSWRLVYIVPQNTITTLNHVKYRIRMSSKKLNSDYTYMLDELQTGKFVQISEVKSNSRQNGKDLILEKLKTILM